MKELSFEKMESLSGGSEYCDLLWAWICGTPGYQGSQSYLVQTWWDNCRY